MGDEQIILGSESKALVIDIVGFQSQIYRNMSAKFFATIIEIIKVLSELLKICSKTHELIKTDHDRMKSLLKLDLQLHKIYYGNLGTKIQFAFDVYDSIEQQKAEGTKVNKKILHSIITVTELLLIKSVTGDETSIPFYDVPTCQKVEYGCLKIKIDVFRNVKYLWFLQLRVAVLAKTSLRSFNV